MTEKEFYYMLAGDASHSHTQEAIKILDEAKVPYRFMHDRAPRYGTVFLFSGLQCFIGLGQIGRIAKRHKLSLEKSVSCSALQ